MLQLTIDDDVRSADADASAWGYEFRLAPGEVESVRLCDLDVLVSPGMELRSIVRPTSGEGSAAEPGFWAGTAVAVDLELDDGTRLSEHGAVDQADYPIDVRAQWDSRALTVDQDNVRTVSLDGIVGRRVIAAHLVGLGVAASGAGVDVLAAGRVSAIGIRPADPLPEDDVDLVDTRRGTNSSGDASRGNTIPAVAVPHGSVFVIPATDASTNRWPYRYGDHAIQAFSVSHSPSPWIGDRGIVQLMPVLDAATGATDRDGRALPFDHADETAGPHRYAVRTGGAVRVSAELTATSRVALFRFTLPDGAGVLVDQLDERGRLRRAEDDTLLGWTDSTVGLAADDPPRMYFAIRFDRPVRSIREAAVADRPGVSAVYGFDAGTVTARVATSFIGTEQALRTLDLEAPAERSFDDVVASARAAWSDRLGVVRIDEDNRGDGGDGFNRDRRTTFVSNLYRMALYPNDASENAGTDEAPRWVYADAANPAPAPHTDDRTGCIVREGRSFVNNGFWDTYRTIWPALSLFHPEDAATMLDGFVEHHRAGGWVERWSAPGAVNCMVGTSSDVVLADALAAGVPLPDLLGAYDSALRNATTVPDHIEVGRADAARAPFRGFVSTATEEGLSWTLESAINDAGIAVLSDLLVDRLPDDHPRREELRTNADWFRRRATTYAACFDPSAGFFVGRGDDGAFRGGFGPRVWGGDYTETNAWGMAVSVPHDGNGLAALYGGPDGLERKLDAYFSTPETAADEYQGTYPFVIHEMREARDVRMGMFGISNQPAHHVPFMYAFTRAPHKGHAIVRESVRRLFLGSELGQGYPGDEDNGEMSAWYVFAAIGLYPLMPGSGELVVVAPSVLHTSIRFGDRTTTITANGLTHEHTAVRSVRVDGQPWSRQTIPIAVLRSGVAIEIDLGPAPADGEPAWGSDPADRPWSLTAPGATPIDPADLTAPSAASTCATGSVADPTVVFDDDSSTGVSVAAGDWIAWELDTSTSIGLVTVTVGTPGAASWTLEIGAGDGWHEVDRRDEQAFRWPQQTRAFAVPGTPAAHRVRLVFTAPADLRQVELLPD